MVNQSDLVELELKSKRFTLALRKKEALEPPEPVYQVGCIVQLFTEACNFWKPVFT